MNRCGTCKWWRRDCYGYAGTPIGEYEDYGQCQKIYEEQSPLVALLTAKTYAVGIQIHIDTSDTLMQKAPELQGLSTVRG